ncbi:MAG: hypothetical protein RDA78_15210 [Roseibium sp.]|uniref:hypothetical protein n=1 Tax=Roseibium sp. TaxID=1936156 RepID=UPI003D9C2DBB
MFRVLLIIGLLVAGVQQGFARGAVDVSKDELQTVVSMDEAVAQLTAGEPDDEQSVAETKPSFCKNSECKAVMASASPVSRAGQGHPDWIAPGHQASVQKRLEPKPPNS